jgi:hypothetical protein
MLLVRSFSTSSRPAPRVAAGGGHPRPEGRRLVVPRRPGSATVIRGQQRSVAGAGELCHPGMPGCRTLLPKLSAGFDSRHPLHTQRPRAEAQESRCGLSSFRGSSVACTLLSEGRAAVRLRACDQQGQGWILRPAVPARFVRGVAVIADQQHAGIGCVPAATKGNRAGRGPQRRDLRDRDDAAGTRNSGAGGHE